MYLINHFQSGRFYVGSFYEAKRKFSPQITSLTCPRCRDGMDEAVAGHSKDVVLIPAISKCYFLYSSAQGGRIQMYSVKIKLCTLVLFFLNPKRIVATPAMNEHRVSLWYGWNEKQSDTRFTEFTIHQNWS